jgi:hypothetical protein
MNKIIEVKTLQNKKLFVKYSDGLEGQISLDKLTTREQYSDLQNINHFEDVKIDEKSGDVIINGNIELCKNAMYGILDLKRQMAGLGLNMDN